MLEVFFVTFATIFMVLTDLRIKKLVRFNKEMLEELRQIKYVQLR